MANSQLLTASLEALKWIRYISYSVQFEERQTGEVRALIDSGSKVNAITPIFVAKLGLYIRATYISAQKIDSSAVKTYFMIIAGF